MAANVTSVASVFSVPAAALPGHVPWAIVTPVPVYLQASISSASTHELLGNKYHKTAHPYLSALPSSQQSVNGDQSNQSNNGLFQLLLLSIASTFGTMGSIFVVSAITVIDTFQVKGNAYLASFALSHLLITVLVLPSSAIAIMAGIQDDPQVCHYQWLTTEVTFLISVLSLTFMGMENFLGLKSTVNYDLCCTKFRIVSIVLLTWLTSIGLVAGQHLSNYGPSLCPSDGDSDEPLLPPKRIWSPYHTGLGIGLIVMPTVLAMWYFSRSIFVVKSYRLQMADNPQSSIYYLTDDGVLNANAAVYTLFLLMWSPLVVVTVISMERPLNQNLLDTCWWTSLTNSVCYSFLYALTNKDFGEAFFKLFYYCCCKSHVSFARKGPRQLIADYEPRLRYHIIPGFNIYAARGAASGTTGGYGHGSHHGGGFGQTNLMMPMGTPGAPRAHHGGHSGMGGYGMVALGQAASGGGMMGGGPFRAFRSHRMSSDL
ncbi:hypothetical protein HDE_08295 [Halotydeus destructor]|nr:hypothetical protein HDE_08295 [Halotydeus destructor]